MSFLIDDLLRDTHDRNKMSADMPAVVTTGFPKYCFPRPVSTLVSSTSCCYTERDGRHGDVSSPSDSDTESSRDSSDSPDPPVLTRLIKTRPSFSAHQVQTLKSVFAHKHYIEKAERKQLAADLNMTDEQVKTWFQNKRTQLKKKKSRVDDHYAMLLYLNEIASGLPRQHVGPRHSPPGYHSYRNGFPVLRSTVDSTLSYL